MSPRNRARTTEYGGTRTILPRVEWHHRPVSVTTWGYPLGGDELRVRAWLWRWLGVGAAAAAGRNQ